MKKLHQKCSIAIIFDVGKTNIKIYYFDFRTDKILFKKKYKNKIINNKEYKLVNLKKIKKILLDHIDNASKNYYIKSIIPVTHGSVLISLDSNDKIINSLSDENIYPVNVDKEYELVLSEMKNTFSPILPYGYNLGKQLFFIKNYLKSDFNKISTILLFPQYLAWFLTGKKTSELSYLGNHSHLWDFKENNFSKLAYDLKLSHFLPKFVSPFKKISLLSKFIRDQKTKNYSTNIYPGCHDSSACYHYHENFNKEDFTLLSTGTWILAFNNKSKITKSMLNQDVLMNINLNGKKVPTIRFPGGIEYSLLTKNLIKPKKINYEIINLILSNKDYILPSFYKGGPYMSKKGKISLKSKKKSNNDYLWHLVNLYLALMVSRMLQIINSNSKLIIDGVFGKNIIFQFFLSNLIDQKVFCSFNEDGVAYGAYLTSKRRKNKIRYELIETKKNKSFIKSLKIYSKFWSKKLSKP